MRMPNKLISGNHWRPVDREILRGLAVCVRLFSLDQLSRMRQSTPAATRQFMRRVADGHLVHKMTVVAQALPPLAGPLAGWRPGTEVPNATNVSRLARKRYGNVRLQKVIAYTATTGLLHHFGCDGQRAVKHDQQTHDLGVSETYLYVRRRWPLLTRHGWVGEDIYSPSRERGEKVEDAQLRHPRTGRVLTVVEFAGKYQTRRVKAFIDWMTYAGQPFLLF